MGYCVRVTTRGPLVEYTVRIDLANANGRLWFEFPVLVSPKGIMVDRLIHDHGVFNEFAMAVLSHRSYEFGTSTGFGFSFLGSSFRVVPGGRLLAGAETVLDLVGASTSSIVHTFTEIAGVFASLPRVCVTYELTDDDVNSIKRVTGHGLVLDFRVPDGQNTFDFGKNRVQGILSVYMNYFRRIDSPCVGWIVDSNYDADVMHDCITKVNPDDYRELVRTHPDVFPIVD